MSLPDFNETGELPEGVHVVSLGEVVARFGGGGAQRRAVSRRLERIFELAKATGGLERFVIFGSSLLLIETVDEFVAHWQVKRDRTRRGIVEVKI